MRSDQINKARRALSYHERNARVSEALVKSARSQQEREQAVAKHNYAAKQAKLWREYVDRLIRVRPFMGEVR